MSNQERQGLDLDDLGLDDFAPRTPANKPKPSQKLVANATQAPSREASIDGQMSIKSPDYKILERFKKMCKDDRRPYYDMLEVLMNAYDKKIGD